MFQKMFTKIHTEYRGRECIKVEGLGPYSLADTALCGQAFRFEETAAEDGYTEYAFTVKDRVIAVGQDTPGTLYFFGLSDGDFDNIAVPYFALDRDLSAMREEIMGGLDTPFMRSASDAGCGIAILRQDPWEALVSFIISQNNNIPRIRKIIRQISAEYGVNITLQNGGKKCPMGKTTHTPCEEICKNCGCCYTFPTAEEILKNPDGLLPSKPGFRYGYILDAAEKVAGGYTDLSAIASGSFEEAVAALKEIRGVGDKVAACVALFGMAKLDAFPVDVWMRRAIDQYFGGSLDPTVFGRYAGVAQQYIFHYIRNIEGGQL